MNKQKVGNCVVCGYTFIGGNRRQYCAEHSAYDHQQLKAGGREHTIKCIECGSMFTHTTENGGTLPISCSPECRKARKQKQEKRWQNKQKQCVAARLKRATWKEPASGEVCLKQQAKVIILGAMTAPEIERAMKMYLEAL